MLTNDDLCELYVARKLLETTDVWSKRYAVTVGCSSDTPGAVTVTVTLANGEEPLGTERSRELEESLRQQLDALLGGKDWRARYPQRTLQFLDSPR